MELPFLCIKQTKTASLAINNFDSSELKALTSLIKSTPNLIDSCITSTLEVSIDIGKLNSFLANSITGNTRSNSSSNNTGVEFGLVDSPPISTISTPSSAINSNCRCITLFSTKQPPSEKESGVILSTDIIKGISLAFDSNFCLNDIFSL